MNIMTVETHSKISQKKNGDRLLSILARAILIFAVLGSVVLGISDQGFAGGWADSMGEGSGVDRSAMISDPIPGSGSSGGQFSGTGAALSTDAMRASMELAISENMASSFDFNGRIQQTINDSPISVPAVPAGNGSPP